MQIWVDAGFDNNTKTAGFGIVIRQLVKNGVKETRLSIKDKAIDNNFAELKAIHYALQCIQGSSNSEPIFIVTDSMVAINCLTNMEYPHNKYKEIIEKIKSLLKHKNWKIYHKKGHSKSKDVYSKRQSLTDRLASQGRKQER